MFSRKLDETKDKKKMWMFENELNYWKLIYLMSRLLWTQLLFIQNLIVCSTRETVFHFDCANSSSIGDDIFQKRYRAWARFEMEDAATGRWFKYYRKHGISVGTLLIHSTSKVLTYVSHVCIYATRPEWTDIPTGTNHSRDR